MEKKKLVKILIIAVVVLLILFIPTIFSLVQGPLMSKLIFIFYFLPVIANYPIYAVINYLKLNPYSPGSFAQVAFLLTPIIIECFALLVFIIVSARKKRVILTIVLSIILLLWIFGALVAYGFFAHPFF